MVNTETFEISISDETLENVKTKLSSATLPNETSFTDDWEYGVPLTDIKRLVAYWKDGYDWRHHESQLNKHPQFKTTVAVDGFGDLDIHFLHQRSDQANAIPLLFVHGCEFWHFEYFELGHFGGNL
jgi:hypothetical protein